MFKYLFDINTKLEYLLQGIFPLTLMSRGNAEILTYYVKVVEQEIL